MIMVQPLYPVHTLEAVKDTTYLLCVLVSKTKGLHLPLSGFTLIPRYIVSRSASGVCIHEMGRNLTIKG